MAYFPEEWDTGLECTLQFTNVPIEINGTLLGVFLMLILVLKTHFMHQHTHNKKWKHSLRPRPHYHSGVHSVFLSVKRKMNVAGSINFPLISSSNQRTLGRKWTEPVIVCWFRSFPFANGRWVLFLFSENGAEERKSHTLCVACGLCCRFHRF